MTRGQLISRGYALLLTLMLGAVLALAASAYHWLNDGPSQDFAISSTALGLFLACAALVRAGLTRLEHLPEQEGRP